VREQDTLLRALVIAEAERAQVVPLREAASSVIEGFGATTRYLLIGREGIKLLEHRIINRYAVEERLR
jgi:hypothetical protein